MPRNDAALSLESLGIQPPYDVIAEQSVLGAVLLETNNVDILLQNLREEMFYVRQNRAVFAEVRNLADASQPVDTVMLVDRLKNDGAFENAAAAQAYLAELVQTVPRISNIIHYINLVRDKYIKRQLMEMAATTLEQASEDIESAAMMESADQKLYEIREGRDTSALVTLRSAMVEIMTHLGHLAGPDRDAYMGVQTGFKVLDRMLTGLGRSDLIILAARPGMGKTSFALNIATNIAKREVPVVIFSLEMTNSQLAGRILSSEAMVDSRVFRSGVENPGDWGNITTMTEVLGAMPMYLYDGSNITISDMKAKIRQLNRTAIATGNKPVGLIIIDYLQLMSTGRRSDNRVQEISEITRGLKIMAKDLDLPVITLSQLSRGPEKGRADHTPALSDLRDSGSIEQDADVVMFLYRDAYYEDEADASTAKCIVAKNRHGDTGPVDLMWDGLHTRFMDVDYSHGGA